jgi:hypothetical protein
MNDLVLAPLAGWIERWRVSVYRGGDVCGGIGERQRRIGASSYSLHRHLIAKTFSGTNTGTRASAAMRGALLDSGRDRALGADDWRR